MPRAKVIDLIGPPRAVPLDDLAPNPDNPRQPWSDDQAPAFTASVQRFGDLGGIVRNVESGHLVGGHKRVDVFRASTDVHVVKVDQPIDDQGTVAHGYVIADGHRFAYREVRWSPDVELAANLAANRWSGEFDWSKVAASLQAITDPDLMPLSGFDAADIRRLTDDGTPPRKGDRGREAVTHVVRLSKAQYALVGAAKTRLTPQARGELTDAGVIELACKVVIGQANRGPKHRRRRKGAR